MFCLGFLFRWFIRLSIGSVTQKVEDEFLRNFERGQKTRKNIYFGIIWILILI